MAEIATEHNGHKITYSENEDVWRCWDLGVEAKTLSALKTKINQCLAQERRVDNVRVWKTEWSGAPLLCAVTLIEGDDHAWISPVDVGALKGKRREKVSFERLILDTAENRAAMETWKALGREADAARKKANEAGEAIPRVTIKALKAAGG